MLVAATPEEPAISRRHVLGMMAGLRALGFDVVPILAEVGARVEDLAELPERLATDTMTRIWDATVRVTGERGLGVQLAELLRIEQYDVFGYVVSTCATLGDALLRGVRLYGLVSGTVRLWVEVDAERTRVILRNIQPEGLHAEAAEFLVASGITVSRQLVGHRVRPLEVRFAHAAPPDPRYLERVFGVMPLFEAPFNGSVLDSSLLALRVKGHNAERNATLLREAEEMLETLSSDTGLERDVLDIVASCLVDGQEPSLERVAAALGLKPKTLNRRLRSVGTGFRDLLTSYRMSLAQRYLSEPGTSVAEVAYRLGYSEKSNFNRAFRKWTGQTPSESRRSTPPKPPSES